MFIMCKGSGVIPSESNDAEVSCRILSYNSKHDIMKVYIRCN